MPKYHWLAWRESEEDQDGDEIRVNHLAKVDQDNEPIGTVYTYASWQRCQDDGFKFAIQHRTEFVAEQF